jgi:hypothetical protein
MRQLIKCRFITSLIIKHVNVVEIFEKVCFHYNSVRYYYSVIGTRSY